MSSDGTKIKAVFETGHADLSGFVLSPREQQHVAWVGTVLKNDICTL